MTNVKIELRPYSAIAILSFLREYINDETKGDYRFKAIQDATEEYEKQVCSKISNEEFDDAVAENEVNYLIGKFPNERV